uniref:Uncharacterized protein n=1 Tax=Meloidogyne hapla TaxID=6305 RepID=A0A1I8AYR7_MELHA
MPVTQAIGLCTRQQLLAKLKVFIGSPLQLGIFFRQVADMDVIITTLILI